MEKIITIGREFGSGGREIGLRLAEKLGIPFYDKELITKAASDGGLSPNIVKEYEESRISGLSVIHAGRNLIAHYQQPLTDQVFLAQSKVIRSLAEKGPCVIVGRCADYVLQGKSINIFVHAELQARIERKSSMDIGVVTGKLEQHILDIDKKRKKYYEYYTDFKWGEMAHFHLCIDTTHVDMDGCANAVFHYATNFR